MTKMKSRLLLSLFPLFIFSSCEKTSLDSPGIESDEKKTTTLNFSIKNLADNNNNDSGEEGHEQYSFLGFGYDVTGKYAHRSSVIFP